MSKVNVTSTLSRGLWSRDFQQSRLGDAAERRYRRVGYWTIGLVFLVILAGGIVRATGSGMGCPDWPKCFGSWVPPTQESQLPPDYQTRYNVHGHGVEPFNAAKTWTEYLNRLLGALAGVLVFGLVLAAVPLRSRTLLPLTLAGIAFVLMAFQGWLGSQVVDANLAPYLVSLHMFVALVIQFVLVAAVAWRSTPRLDIPLPRLGLLRAATLVFLVLVLVQILLGTQVREAIDEVALADSVRGTWVERLGLIYYVHRSFSILLVLASIGLGWLLYEKTRRFGHVYYMVSVVFMLIAAEVVLGVALAYAGFPAWAQPLHLLLGSGLAVAVFFIFMVLLKQKLSFSA
jgi:cytochrome c oxidase assembly protein subunit 15